MRLSEKWLVLWSLWAARLVRQWTAPVRCSSGLLRGEVAPTGSHAAYLGIPYASITHRFQAPTPRSTWHGVFDAINENIYCPQLHSYHSRLMVGHEDCLILNVFTPINNRQGSLLPVMVYFHGGGFFEGSSWPAVYGPEYLIKKDVILVTVNYRLNMQGFLCLGIKEAPGNAGLKDQVEAMKWIQKNIKAFGGDPDNVTIFGESAGSASVSFLILSPMAKGLFHKAIMQSGSALASWSFQQDPIHVASLKAKLWGFESEDPHDLYKFFINMTDHDLIVRIVPKAEGNIALSQLILLPCAEKKLDGVDPFLTQMPHEIISKGIYNKVAMMTGVTSQEGLLFVGMESKDYLPNITIDKSLAKNLEFPSTAEREMVVDKLQNLYMGDNGKWVGYENMSKYIGDMMFHYPSVEEAVLLAKHNDMPVFSYLFNYDGWKNILKYFQRRELKNIAGATHTDDIFYIFSQYIIPYMFESRMIDRMTTLWTNFAKYGDPTPSVSELLPLRWHPVTGEKSHTFVIDDQLSTIPLLGTDALALWKNVYDKYRRKHTTFTELGVVPSVMRLLPRFLTFARPFLMASNIQYIVMLCEDKPVF
ncbi:hypothetical protein ACJJTC_012119 [Scirpophaga incertulas]